MGRQQRRRQERRQRAAGARGPQRAQRAGGASSGGGRPPVARSTPSNNRPWLIGAIAAIVLVIAAVGVAVYVGHNSNNSASSPTATPAPTAASASSSPAVDGVQCAGMEQLSYHIHQHLDLYVNGKSVQLPSSIGIPGSEDNATCFYWIHVHAGTPNIIHIESPIKKIFNFGNFMDIWKATTSTTVPPNSTFPAKLAAGKRGNVHAFLNGKPWKGSYRSIPLKAHAVITVEIGKPVVPPKPFNSWNGL